jgi:hypothetical protein
MQNIISNAESHSPNKPPNTKASAISLHFCVGILVEHLLGKVFNLRDKVVQCIYTTMPSRQNRFPSIFE